MENLTPSKPGYLNKTPVLAEYEIMNPSSDYFNDNIEASWICGNSVKITVVC